MNMFVKREDGEEENVDTNEKIQIISHTEGLKCIDAALAYIVKQEESLPPDILGFQRWWNFASSKRGQRLNEKSIKDFSRNDVNIVY